MNKSEIIESLYKAGKITFNEAMILASEKNEEVVLKEQNLTKFISEIVEPHTEYDPDEDRDVLVSFDIDECIELMRTKGHTWYNLETDCDETVTAEMLKEYLRKNIRKCVKEFIEQNKKEKKNDDYCTIDGGGYIVECRWYDEQMTSIVCEVMYVPTRNMNVIKFEDLV